ncbi:hypothetical protein [Kosakonia sacchari]|uniref:hypothetical protein n=1 Tax=Kosakonia sacchari TaxID=1158459 RepID=UPI00158544BB|nr:hypothetical protein [Kosakonia sacchari]NUL36605.1 hypothetical protein [Kosakonia sacchari]
MKRVDQLLDPLLTRICRSPELSPEQKRRNQEWAVKIRKQIDAARLAGAKK